MIVIQMKYLIIFLLMCSFANAVLSCSQYTDGAACTQAGCSYNFNPMSSQYTCESSGGGGGGGGNTCNTMFYYCSHDSSIYCSDDSDCNSGANTCAHDGVWYSCSQNSMISCSDDSDCNGCVGSGMLGYYCEHDSSISCSDDSDCTGPSCVNTDCSDDRYDEFSASSETGCDDGCSTPADCTVGANGQLCQNGGFATGYKTGTCGCQCPAGYSGDNCQTASACTAGANGQACQNGGTVTGTTGSCSCNCASGYSGNNCETADACTTGAGGNACQNGGTIGGTTGNCRCDCATGFGGDNCETCASGYSGTNCENFDGVDPDYYEPSDAEPDPLPDGDWETQDVACGDGNFVSLATNGEFSCKSCTQAGQGKTAFLAEFNSKRGAGQGSGVYHGKCCINGHHKVCQQLLKSYKQNCDDSDKGHDSNRECVAV